MGKSFTVISSETQPHISQIREWLIILLIGSLHSSNQYGYCLDLVMSVFTLDVDELDSLSCLNAFLKKKAIASCAPRFDRPRDRQTMLPTSRSPLAIIWRDDFFPGSLHGEVLAVGAEETIVAAVLWEPERLGSAASKSWGN